MNTFERDLLKDVVRSEIDKKNQIDNEQFLNIISSVLFIIAMFILIVCSLISANSLLKILELMEV